MLVGLRGVKRTSQYLSSNASSWPSIQPWQSAASMASSLETLWMPDDFLASFSHRPFAPAGCTERQASHASREAKARTGRSRLVLVFPATGHRGQEAVPPSLA